MNANDRVGKPAHSRVETLPDNPYLKVENGKMTCPYCFGFAPLVREAKVRPTYKGPGGKQFYHCAPCDAYVGCHEGTTQPLGRLANAQLRRAKQQAHTAFDPIWRSGGMSRSQAYEWLAVELRITNEACHIGMFTVPRCERTIALCRKYLASQRNAVSLSVRTTKPNPMVTRP